MYIHIFNIYIYFYCLQSMEECEMLCDKIGFMKNGRLQCVGSIDELKNKYGGGYGLIVKCKHGNNYQETIKRLNHFVFKKFPQASLEGKLKLI
jgi:ATP-binding cassette, subfamily A (ABC1), member 3